MEGDRCIGKDGGGTESDGRLEEILGAEKAMKKQQRRRKRMRETESESVAGMMAEKSVYAISIF